MFESFHTKTKLILASVITVVVIGAYVATFFVINHIKGVIDSSHTQVQELQASQSRLIQARSMLTDTVAEQEKINNYVLSGDEVVGFIEYVEGLVQSARLSGKIDSVATARYSGTDAAQWEWLQVSLSTDGSWVSTYQFLSLLEQIPYRSNLNSADIQKAEASKENNGKWHGEFVLLVLKRK